MPKKNKKSNVREEKATPEQTSEPVSQQTSEPAVAPPVVATAAPEPEKKAEPKPAPTPKEKKPTISATTRKLVILNQEKTVEEISQMLVADGWDKDDVAKRQSTIASFRTDTLSTVRLVKEMGLWKQ